MGIHEDNQRRLTKWEESWQSGPPDPPDEIPEFMIEDEINSLIEDDLDYLQEAIGESVSQMSTDALKSLSIYIGNGDHTEIGRMIVGAAREYLWPIAEEKIEKRGEEI